MKHSEDDSGNTPFSGFDNLTFVERGNRLRATREPYIDPETHVRGVIDTVTDLETGRVYGSTTRVGPDPESLGASARSILESVDLPEVTEEQRSMRNLHSAYPELAEGAELPNGPLPRIKLRFARGFASRGIRLPEDDVVHRRAGCIHQGGWSISYLFGVDESGEYIEYYASHRMTNDTHSRLYEDGRREWLPALDYGRSASSDPEEDARLAAEHREEQERIMAMLKAKGFW